MKILTEDKYFQYGFQQPIRFYRLKLIAYPFLNLFYHILTSFIYKYTLSHKKEKSRYRISLVLIFKDEAPFLKEWLEYHLMIGVEHFYLYQNNSTDPYQQVIAPYQKRGLITLTEWPEYPGQYSAYMHWYQNYRHETKWVSFIDADEFLCPTKATSLHNTLQQYEKYPVILVYWKLFGTGGIMQHDYNKLVIEQYTSSRPKLYTEGKIFYNTRFDINDDFISMHGMNTRWGSCSIPPVNTFGKFIIWNFHRVNRKKDAVLQLNHYWSKAYDCWKQKFQKGSIEKGTRWKDYSFLEKLEIECTSCDFTIFRFLMRLKLRMANGKKGVQKAVLEKRQIFF